MRDVLRVSRAPIIASHSSAFSLAHTTRNVPDDVLKSVAKNRFTGAYHPQRAG